MDFTVGLLALAVGLAFDMQRLIPAIGDRIAAVCALTVGGAWLSGGQIGGWFSQATDRTTGAVGGAAHQIAGDVPSSSGQQVLGIVVAVAFLIWLLAMLPGFGFVTKHVSPSASKELSSGLIWMGTVFPPLIGLVPGWWGQFATSVTFAGVEFGRWASGMVLG